MKALDGIRVIDLTHAVSGPTCTFQLAMLGADVIKVERPQSGDPLRGYSEHAGPAGMASPFLAINAGKKSVVLDLKTPEGMTDLRELIADADVVIENYRPGAAEKMGIDWDSLKQTNPDLILCSISGFGQTGPLRSRPAYDHILQAMSGLMSVNGHPDDDPVMLGVPISDTFTGFIAALSIVSAVLRRERTGKGQRIDVSMLSSSLTLLNQSVATYLLSGAEPVRRGNRGFRMVPTADLFPTATSPIALGANDQRQVERMCRALNIESLLDDPRFATFEARQAHAAELRQELIQHFSTLDATDIEERLAVADVPAGVVRTVPEIIAHPHVRDSGVLQEVTLGDTTDTVQLIGPAWTTDADGPSIEGGVPVLGQHTSTVLNDTVLDNTEPDE